jgi:hypothetical protein
MEMWIWLEAENVGMCPETLTSSLFSEHIDEYERHVGNLKNVIRPLVERLNLNLGPLLRQGGWEFSRGEFPSDEIFAEYQKQREDAWQPPQDLIDCLTNILRAIDANPGIFAEIGLSRSRVEGDLTGFSFQGRYFLDGGFRRDLLTLLGMAEWAKNTGTQRIRLIGGEG